MKLIIALSILLCVLRVSAQTTLNVTNYGAKGDAVQFYVNTVSNSVVVTTTNTFSASDIGKTMEVYGVGKPTYGVNGYGVTTNGNQDFIGVVTNVVNGTNLYLQVIQLSAGTTNYPISLTSTNTFATIGTDNTTIINNLIQTNAAAYSNATIYFPNGTYLCLSSIRADAGYGSHAILFLRGGIKIEGESQTGTILLSRGAWQSWGDGTYPARGFLFEIVAPITNDIPITIANLTADGGVVNGNIDVRGIQCNEVDGLGWDQQHSAILCQGMPTHLVVTNVTSQHWRGEIFKTIGESKNGNVFIHDCKFIDGNASALNIYGSWDVRNNYFEKLFFLFEYYQSSYTNAAFFTGNFSTNTTSGVSFNGALLDSPPFTVQSNTLYLTTSGANAFLTVPAANVNFLDNEIHCAPFMTALSVGGVGAQVPSGPTAAPYNTNITFIRNHIYCDARMTAVVAWAGSDVNYVSGLSIISNTLDCASISGLFSAYSAATNVTIAYNNFNTHGQTYGFGFIGAGYFPLVQTNNIYTPVYINSGSVATNLVTWNLGPKQYMDYVVTSNRFILSDATPSDIPSGAWFEVDNRTNRASGNIMIQPSQASGSSITLSNGYLTTFYWDGTKWATNAYIPPVTTYYILIKNDGGH